MTQTLNAKVLIIGAGAGGYVTGMRCGQLGLETVQRLKGLLEHPATLWVG